MICETFPQASLVSVWLPPVFLRAHPHDPERMSAPARQRLFFSFRRSLARAARCGLGASRRLATTALTREMDIDLRRTQFKRSLSERWRMKGPGGAAETVERIWLRLRQVTLQGKEIRFFFFFFPSDGRQGHGKSIQGRSFVLSYSPSACDPSVRVASRLDLSLWPGPCQLDNLAAH